MKKLLLIVVLFVGLITIATPDTTYVVKGVVIDTESINNYCKGFREGFADGYCYNDPFCVPPVAPICPIRHVNEQDNYKGGYQRGFKRGLEMRNK